MLCMFKSALNLFLDFILNIFLNIIRNFALVLNYLYRNTTQIFIYHWYFLASFSEDKLINKKKYVVVNVICRHYRNNLYICNLGSSANRDTNGYHNHIFYLGVIGCISGWIYFIYAFSSCIILYYSTILRLWSIMRERETSLRYNWGIFFS